MWFTSWIIWDTYVLLTYKAYIICAPFPPYPSEIISYHDPIDTMPAIESSLLFLQHTHLFPAPLPSPTMFPLSRFSSPTCIHGSCLLFINAVWKCHTVRELFPWLSHQKYHCLCWPFVLFYFSPQHLAIPIVYMYLLIICLPH